MTRKVIFPVTRVHEPLRAEVEVEAGRVTDAWVSGLLFRGFEAIMHGRDPRDAVLLAQRICGICSGAHAVAGAMALEEAFGVQATPDGQLLTNLIFAADVLQNHLRHFYLLVLYDYVAVSGQGIMPFVAQQKGDFRLPHTINDEILEHAKVATLMAARAHSMMAIFGAKAPMQQTIVPTGVTEAASSDKIMAYGSILRELKEFVEQVYIGDVLTIAEYYPDYYAIGRGYSNLFSFGMFPAPITGKRAFSPGLILKSGPVEELDAAELVEDSNWSWYDDQAGCRHPNEGKTTPDIDKPDAYSWVKAPRYRGMALECGPLARGWINGDYRRGISVMDRIVARAREAFKIAGLAEEWLAGLTPGAPTLSRYSAPPKGRGMGLTDAMRGALGHWLTYEDGKVTKFQIITPTTWNFSPRDTQGVRGPVEEALIGTPVMDADNLIEVGRVIRSFDPCISCAVHLFEAK
ncbi:MAG: Periplasmic [NiFeSe] hydrogenase large subunit [Firmicutes bacterium]|nr:Periplasmic [NiFeSe] hydrogenase large subunit [Bacillota bacterium]